MDRGIDSLSKNFRSLRPTRTLRLARPYCLAARMRACMTALVPTNLLFCACVNMHQSGQSIARSSSSSVNRLSRSVQRPAQCMAAVRALPMGDAWDGVRGQPVHSGHAAFSSASSNVRQTAIHSVPWFWNTQKSRPLEEKRSPERS
jgi:hypothetical protein